MRLALATAAVLLVLALPLATGAQQPGKTARIGVLARGVSEPPSAPDRLAQHLRALGWVEGQNLVFERRFAGGKPARLPALAAELIDRNVSVIFTRGTPAALAAKRATVTIPIVMVFVADPVRSGLLTSLARPGGNVTGMAFFGPDVVTKQLELLKEIVPHASTVGILFDALNPAHVEQLIHEVPAAAAALALKIQPLKVDATTPLDTLFAEKLSTEYPFLGAVELQASAAAGSRCSPVAAEPGRSPHRRGVWR